MNITHSRKLFVMKFECYAHRLFDAIRKGRMVCGHTPETQADVLQALQGGLSEMQTYPVYVIREPANEVFDDTLLEIAGEWSEAGKIRLPWPAMLLQVTLTDAIDRVTGLKGVPDIWMIKAVHEDGDPTDIWVELTSTSLDELDEWVTTPMAIRIRPSGLEILSPEWDVPPASWLPESWEGDIKDAAGFLCGTIVMMSSPAVEVESVRVPRDINRGRRILKRSPIPDHSVLRLPRVAWVPSESDRAAGHHARPRTHWRRAHQREYSPGKFTDIPLTLVARKEGDPLPPPPVIELITRRPVKNKSKREEDSR